MSESLKTCVPFSCQGFDPTLNHWTRPHKLEYDPFIFPNTTSQVYFMPRPYRSRDRVNWLDVIPTRPRAGVDVQYNLPIAYQQTVMTTLGEPTNDVISTLLMDESAPPEDVNDDLDFSFIQVNDDIDEAEGDDSDKEGEWDDGNETGEEGGDIHLYDDENDDDDDDENENGNDDADDRN